MKIGIYYFSGTGNTKWVAAQMKELLKVEKNEVEMYSIDENPIVNEVDLLVIGGPIYAGNMPEKLIRWVLRNVPDSEGTKAIVFTTSAGLDNAFGAVSVGKKLQKKGYQVIRQFKYKLPRNFYFTNYDQTPQGLIPELVSEAQRKISEELFNIKALNTIEINDKTLSIDLMAELMSVMTRFMGKNFAVTESCIKCGKCELQCPTKNIQIGDVNKYGMKCMMCTKCLHDCPVNAITYKNETFEQYQRLSV